MNINRPDFEPCWADEAELQQLHDLVDAYRAAGHPDARIEPLVAPEDDGSGSDSGAGGGAGASGSGSGAGASGAGASGNDSDSDSSRDM
jgi:hypothetical protein